MKLSPLQITMEKLRSGPALVSLKGLLNNQTVSELERALFKFNPESVIVNFSGVEDITGAAWQRIFNLADHYRVAGAGLPKHQYDNYHLLEGEKKLPVYKTPEEAIQYLQSQENLLSRYTMP
ncbi:hypothetical protein D6764_00670 [Candidatus Woesearchaeota archaeon]|nr:MAG: hypothetical protein D6764_00670 [Candidatus Woesearchaeota archaeon]